MKMIDERSKMINECFPNISEAEKQMLYMGMLEIDRNTEILFKNNPKMDYVDVMDSYMTKQEKLIQSILEKRMNCKIEDITENGNVGMILIPNDPNRRPAKIILDYGNITNETKKKEC